MTDTQQKALAPRLVAFLRRQLETSDCGALDDAALDATAKHIGNNLAQCLPIMLLELAEESGGLGELSGGKTKKVTSW